MNKLSGLLTTPSAKRVLTLFLLTVLLGLVVSAQKRTANRTGSHSVRPRPTMSAADRSLVEEAMGVVCTEGKLDPKGSTPIDDMQARPSLPVQSSEAIAGAKRAERLLPVAKDLVINALRQLVTEYGLQKSPAYATKLQRAITRVQTVRKVRPDMESRDNASVFLTHPHTITFGTIFLAGLPSDEGMISVLAHELMHIADGDNDLLYALVRAIAAKGSSLTGLEIRGQRSEELACDLVGAMAVRSYVADTPSYEPLPRRLSRSLQHNCVDLDEGDEDHLSPRTTIRVLLSLNSSLVRELIYGRDERPTTRP
jgi:hypothetical protein